MFGTSFPSTNFFLAGVLIEPVGSNCLSPGKEVNAIFTKNMEITKEGVLIAREREVSARNWNTNIYAHHTAICLHDKLAGIIATAGEDTGSIGKWIGIHDLDAFFIILNSLDTGNRAKDFAIPHTHAWFNMIENGWSNKEAIFVALWLAITAIQYQLESVSNKHNADVAIVTIDSLDELLRMIEKKYTT